MEHVARDSQAIDQRIAERLKALRLERGWSLHKLAGRSDISRATLSRLENAEVSATAVVLGRLCAVYGLTMSRLMRMVEDEFTPMIPKAAQPVWSDPALGFKRRSVSPPADTLAGEVLACELEPGARITYDTSPKPGLEHHLLMLDGCLELSIEDQHYTLSAGDCLRYQLHGKSAFTTPDDCGARYVLFMV